MVTKQTKGVSKTDKNLKILPQDQKYARKILNEITIEEDPDILLKKVAEAFRRRKGSGETKEVIEELTEIIRDAAPIAELDNHYLAAYTVLKYNRPLVIEFANNLIEEYKCQTASEKSLANIAATAYVRILQYSRKFNDHSCEGYISSEKNGYFNVLSKEIDRAFRQFQSSVAMLKQMKTPAIQVSVKTKTAFIAENQQINAMTDDDKQDNNTNYEIKASN